MFSSIYPPLRFVSPAPNYAGFKGVTSRRLCCVTRRMPSSLGGCWSASILLTVIFASSLRRVRTQVSLSSIKLGGVSTPLTRAHLPGISFSPLPVPKNKNKFFTTSDASTAGLLDSPDVGVIDYARFLAFTGSTDHQRLGDAEDDEPNAPSENQVKLLSDQKNYLEELNRHFEAKLKDSKGELIVGFNSD